MSGELPRRLLVAAVGVPAVILLLWAGGWYLSVPVALLAALGADELYRMAARRDVRAFRWPGTITAGGLVLLAGWFLDFSRFAPWALAWMVALLMGCLAASLVRRGPGERPLSSVAVTVTGALYAGLLLSFALFIYALPAREGWTGSPQSVWAGTFAVAFPVASTWVGDASAYFVGTAVGRHKLAPSLSPGKSWEGSVAGFVGAGATAGVWHVLARPALPDFPLGLGVTIAVGALLGAGALMGDLVESLLKREAEVKDSGTLFPGHGGVLDRLDALTFTLPLAYGLLILVSGALA